MIIKETDYKSMPWKNGRGITWQIDADTNWRLSTARVEEDGPFSYFPDHQRLITIVEGAGLKLFHGERKIDLLPGVIHQFAGIEDTRSELVDGAIRDLNLFWRPEFFKARMRVLHEKKWNPEGDINFLYAGDTYRVAGRQSLPWPFKTSAIEVELRAIK